MVVWVILIFIAIVTAAVIFTTVKVITKKKELEKVINAEEPRPRVFKTPKKFEFSSTLECLINEKYTEYISAYNSFIKEKGHLEYLKERLDAEHKLGLEGEDSTRAEIEKCAPKVESLRASMEKIHWHNYFCSKADSAISLFEKFKDMCNVLPVLNKVPEPMYSFAQNGKPWISLSDGVKIMLSEFFVALWNTSENSIRIYKYESLQIKSDYTIKSLPFGTSPKVGEEVAKKHWKHERADGTPDKRFQDNPTRVDVFCAHIVFTLGDYKAKIDTLSKSKAESMEKRINAYKKSVAAVAIRKYVDFVFTSDTMLFKLENIEKKIEFNKALLEKEKEAKKELKYKEKRSEKEKKSVDNRADPVDEKKEDSKPDDNFSEEEIQMILDARREKEERLAREEKERKRLEAVARVEAVEQAPISQVGGTRVITNNIFTFNYKVERAVDCEVELFFANEIGEVISKSVRTMLPPIGESFRHTFELLSEKSFESGENYYLFVRPVGELEPIGKLDYKINISFALDFDF